MMKSALFSEEFEPRAGGGVGREEFGERELSFGECPAGMSGNDRAAPTVRVIEANSTVG